MVAVSLKKKKEKKKKKYEKGIEGGYTAINDIEKGKRTNYNYNIKDTKSNRSIE